MFGPFKTTAASQKIDKSTAQVLELEAQKKRLELDNEQIQLELNNQKRRNEMKLEEESHKHKLTLESEKAVFNRERDIWKQEKVELVERAARDKKEFEETLNQKNALILQEAVTLAKLDAAQKVKQAELDKDRAINLMIAKHAEELAKVKADTAKDHYEKLTTAFQEIQLNGDKNSKFVQEMASKMMDHLPTARTRVDVGVNQPMLEAKSAKR